MPGYVQSLFSAIDQGLNAAGADADRVKLSNYVSCAMAGTGICLLVSGIQDTRKGDKTHGMLKCLLSITLIARACFDIVTIWSALLNDTSLTACRYWEVSPNLTYEQTCSLFGCSPVKQVFSSTCPKLQWGTQFHEDTCGRGFSSLAAMERSITT